MEMDYSVINRNSDTNKKQLSQLVKENVLYYAKSQQYQGFMREWAFLTTRPKMARAGSSGATLALLEVANSRGWGCGLSRLVHGRRPLLNVGWRQFSLEAFPKGGPLK